MIIKSFLGALQYFTTNQWSWNNTNVDKLRSILVHHTDEQSFKTFDFDMRSMDWKVFLDFYVLGTRHYVLKNDPDTMQASRKKQRVLHLVHVILQVVFALFMYYLLFRF